MNRKTTRIEPTLTGEPNNLDAQTSRVHQASSVSNPHHNRSSARQQKPAWRLLLETQWQKIQNALLGFIRARINNEKFTPKKRVIIGAVGVVFIFALWLIFSGDTKQETPVVPEIKIAQENTLIDLTVRENKVTLPDNFSVMTTKYQGVVIGWQGNVSNQSSLWNIFNAQGDSSCQNVTFNRDDQFPILEVKVENNEHYFAYFSPTVTSEIIKAIALRSTFKLCGYEFSLKGSQATLGKNPYYSDFLLN